MTTEASLWDRARPGLVDAARATRHPRIALERIENVASRSMPDTHGRWATFEFWLELKVARGASIKFEPGQVDWLVDQWACRANSFVLVAEQANGKWHLFRGEQAPDLENGAWRAVRPELSGQGGAADWAALLERITWGGDY